MADGKEKNSAPITIKKYANRRLYNTATSSYVTLEYLCAMVKDGIDFVVHDAKSGDDITRSVLTQIIVEEEAKGHHLLPIEFLRQLIGCYGDAMRQSVLPGYLEHSMASFMRNQDGIRDALRGSLGDTLPIDRLEEMGAKNMAMFEQAIAMINPFAGTGAPAASRDEPQDDRIDALTRERDALQARIDRLNRTKD
jgi:polyhydroxyalkanoate synthesis repressor PhaR